MKKRLWKKVCGMVLAVCLGAGLLAGCEKTPDQSIVREKGANGIKNYESEGKDDGTSLKEKLKIPERYMNKASYEEGALVIDTDAKVVVPDVSSMDTIAVSAMEADQALLDTVTKAFFGDSKIYNGLTYTQMTKEQVQKQLTQLKKYKAEGNIDPYKQGKDENGQLYFDIDAQITRYERELQTAPEEAKKEEVKPAFGMEYFDEKTGEIEKFEDSFIGVAETEQGNYDYRISSYGGPDITFDIEKIRTDLPDRQEMADWQEGEYIMDNDGPNGMTEEEIKQMFDISYEDARKMAEEKVKKLGLDLEIYNYDYALFYHGEEGFRKENVLDTGYLFHFERVIRKVPITFTSEYGGGLEDMDSTLTPWGYERCDVIVGNDGIQKVKLMCPYNMGEVQTENVKLMDFDSIMEIYEQMMEVSNVDITQYEKQRTYHIKKITLGYSRIYNPASKNDEGLLVPVWDFFGGFDVESEVVEQSGSERETSALSEKHSGEHSNQSFLTINGIDGTVIDRGLGY